MTDTEFETLYETSLSAAITSGGTVSVTVGGMSRTVDYAKLMDLIEKERQRRSMRSSAGSPFGCLGMVQLKPPGGGG